jgi:outer membrane protein assembly factor BamA
MCPGALALRLRLPPLSFFLAAFALVTGLPANASRFPSIAGKRCAAIDSDTFERADLGKIARALGLAVGTPVDFTQVNEGIRKLYREGFVETLWVRTETTAAGIRVVVDGERRRALRQLRIEGLDGIEGPVESDAKRASGLVEGQPASIASIERLRHALRSLLADRGYPAVQVDAKTLPVDGGARVDVRVEVRPGPRTIVRSLRVDGVPAVYLARLRLAMPLREGRPIERRLMEASESALVTFLRGAQYPVARVVGRDVQLSDDRQFADVRFRVETGDRLLFLFRGMKFLDEVELRTFLTDDVLSQTDGPRVVADRIVERYKQLGYAFCRVDIEREDQRQARRKVVTFRIVEGARVFVDKLSFNGVDEDEQAKLRSLFDEVADPVLARGLFVEKALEPAARAMEVRLKADGYLQAAIGLPRFVYSDDKKGVDVSYDVVLGPRTLLRTVELRGDPVLSAAEAEKLLGIPVGGPVDIDAIRRGRAAVLERIRDEGYLDASLGKEDEASWLLLSDDRRQGTVVLDVTAGPRYRTGAVRIEGNRRTRNKVLEREIHLKTGDWVSPRKIQASEENTLLLGLFSRVDTAATDGKPAPDGSPTKDIVLRVQETKPGVGEVGFGALYEEPRLRVRGFFGVAYRNLFGLNHTASARTQLSLPFSRTQLIPFVEHATVFTYRAPYPFDLPFHFNLQLGLDSFEVSPEGPRLQTRKRVEARLEKRFTPWLMTFFRLHRFEETKTEDLSLVLPAETESIGSTGPGVVLDFRDDPFNPRRGSYHTFDLELAYPALGSQANIGHLMALHRNTVFFPLFGPLQFSGYAGLGYATSLVDGEPIATARLTNDLALGGQGTIRGFTLRRFTGDKVNPKPTTLAFYNVRAEVAWQLVADLSFAVFGDTGQLFPDWRTEPRHDGVGVGVRYKTPVGPVVVDFAQGLGPDRESVKFYFTVGTL